MTPVVLVASACAFPAVGYLDDEQGAGAGAAGPTSSSSSTGGAGGSAPKCLLGGSDCGTEMKCSVVNLQTGAVDCIPAGAVAWFARCTQDTDCINGAFCDLQRNVCKPFCTTDNDCKFSAMQFNGDCLPLLDSQAQVVPGGHRLCIPNCDPRTADPCDKQDYVNCIHIGIGSFDCAETQNKLEGSNCAADTECAPGLLCETGTCRRWCTAVGTPSIDCLMQGTCSALNPPVTYNNTAHGACPAP